MTTPLTLPAQHDVMLRNQYNWVPDPGSAGTIVIQQKGHAICELTTAGGEGRFLEAVGTGNTLPVGQELLVTLGTAGGVAAIVGAVEGSVTLSVTGDMALFVVGEQIVNGVTTRVWHCVWGPNSFGVNRGVASGASIAATTDTATLTAAQLLARVIRGVPTSGATYTLPTAALMVAGVAGVKVGDYFDFVVSNKAATSLTIQMAAGGATLEGNTGTIAQNAARLHRLIFTNVTSGAEAYSVIGM